jgi:hypothetical protein
VGRRFSAAFEPVVRLIEETPREKCPTMMIEQLRNGLPYRNFLAALYLANIRTAVVDHPLAVLHSANEFHAGMLSYDSERAERAIAALVRSHGAARIAELLWHYGARDWFFIGHQPIWAANCWRPLEQIGWQHAEPTLRVVVTSILGNEKDLTWQPYAANSERVRKALDTLPADWAESACDTGFVRELLALWRESTSVPRSESPRRGEFPGAVDSRITAHAIQKREAACELIATRLVEGKVRAGAVWDAVHLAAGEMMMCAHKGPEPGHAYTATNALHYAFTVSGEPANRLLLLLQAVGWLFHFRENMADKGWLKEPKQITELVGDEIPGDPDAAVDEILAQLSFGSDGKPTADPTPGFRGVEFNDPSWRHAAARRAFTFAQQFPGSQALTRAAFRLLPLKADWDPHRIKFPIAASENHGWVSAEWRPHMLAAASYVFLGKDALDTDLAKQVSEALRSV